MLRGVTEPGAQTGCQILIFILVYLFIGCVSLDDLQNITRFSHIFTYTWVCHGPCRGLS